MAISKAQAQDQAEAEAPAEEEAVAVEEIAANLGDEVLYCRGYKETGEKDETGNRILEPDYAPATIYQVDDERKATGHVLLVYASDNQGGKQSAWAHNADGVPGYWTARK